MRDEERKPSGAPTPEKDDRALADLAVKLAELDAAEGVFGEAMLDEELDTAVGGGDTSSSPFLTRCKRCGAMYTIGKSCWGCFISFR